MNAQRKVPVPLGLRVRRRVRSVPLIRTVNVLRQVLAHPANDGDRLTAVRRAVWWQVRSRVSSAPMDLPVHGDLVLRCHPRSNAASNVIYFTERHDPAEMELIERWVRPGDDVVDAGANIGTYTLLLAKLVGPSGAVMAIEPSSLAARRLAENIELNGLHWVQTVECAIGREDGIGQLTADSDVSNTLTVGPGSYDVVDVPVRSLDSLLPDRCPTLIKLDVEGFEGEALAGARSLLARCQPVILLELTDHLLELAGSSRRDVRQTLEAMGYRIAYPVWVDGRLELTADEAPNAVAVPGTDWGEFCLRVGVRDLQSPDGGDLKERHAAGTAMQRRPGAGDLVRAKDDWDMLSARAGTPFTSWSWSMAWRTVYGGRSEPALFVARRGGRVRGIAPYARVRAGALPMYAGMGQEISDFGGFLVEDGAWSDDVTQELFDALVRTGARAVLNFGRVEPSSALDRLVSEAARRGRHHRLDLAVEAYPSFDLTRPDATQRVNRLLKRNDVRRRLRRLGEVHAVEFVAADDDERALETFFDLHDRRWSEKSASPGGTFVTARGRAFWRHLQTAPIGERPVISTIRADGVPVASRVGFLHRGVYYGLKSAFDPTFSEYGPGHMLVGELLRTGLEEGWERFEFMRGAGAHKHAWADESRDVPYVLLVPGTAPRPAIDRIVRAILGARYRTTYATKR